MSVFSDFLFLKDIDQPATSNDFAIITGTSLIFEVSGTFTGVELIVEGKIDLDSEQWVTLPIVNMNTLTTVSQITDVGLYRIDVSGLSTVHAKLNAITTGEIKMFGKLVIEAGR